MNLRERIYGRRETFKDIWWKRIRALNPEETIRLVSLATQYNNGLDIKDQVDSIGTVHINFSMVIEKAKQLKNIT